MTLIQFQKNNLIDFSKPYVYIRFIKNGEEHSFYSCVNSLTDNRLSGFDHKAPSIDDTLAWVKSVLRDIEMYGEPIEKIGNM